MSNRSRLSAGGSNPLASASAARSASFQSPAASFGSNRQTTNAEVNQIVDAMLSGSSGIPTLKASSDIDVAPVIAVQGPETTGIFTEVAEIPVGSDSLRRSSNSISRGLSDGQVFLDDGSGQSFRILTEARTSTPAAQVSTSSARPASSYSARNSPASSGSASNNFLPALMSSVKSASTTTPSVTFSPNLWSSKQFSPMAPVAGETTVCLTVDDEFAEELAEDIQEMEEKSHHHHHHHHKDKHHKDKHHKKGLFGKVEDTADNLQSAVKKIPRWVYLVTAFGLLVVLGMWLWKRIFIQYTDGPRVGDKKGSRSFGRLLGDGFIFQAGGAKPLAHPDTATKIILGSGQPTAVPIFSGKAAAAAAAAATAAASGSQTKETVVVTQRAEPSIVIEKTVPATGWPAAVPTTTTTFMPTAAAVSPTSGMQIVSDFERSPAAVVVAGSTTGAVATPVVTREVIDTSTTSVNLPQTTFTDWFKSQNYPK